MGEPTGLDTAQLRGLYATLKKMDDKAKDEAKRSSSALAEYAQKAIYEAAGSRGTVASRIAKGSKIQKSATTGAITYGYASQKFSGGATTKDLWGGEEFGSNKYRQFPNWSGRYGRGSKGWFIYPTLRKMQPFIVSEWLGSFDRIIKEWD